MKLEQSLHTGFTVSNLERSIAFYRDILGMTLLHRQRGTAPYLATVTGFTGVEIDVALLKSCPDDPHIIELLQYLSHPAEPTDRATNRPGNVHLCVRVDRIEDWHRKLFEAGVPVISKPARITAGVNQGAYAMYLRDPDGITIELYQPAAANSQPVG